MLNLLIFLFILSVLIVVHEFGHFIVAKLEGVRVEVFSLGFGTKILSRKRKDTEYCVGVVPLGGYVKLAGDNLEEYKGNPDEYFSKPPSQRAAIVFFGPLLNYFLGFVCFWTIFFAGYPNLTTRVGDVVEGMGAEAAGIQTGDIILSVNGQKVKFWEEMQKIIRSSHPTEEVDIVILRNNAEYPYKIRLKEQEIDDPLLGEKKTIGLIGIKQSSEFIKVRHGFFESFTLAGKRTVELTVMTYKALWRMITGKLSLRESVTGPLGIFYITSEAASLGIIALLNLVAVLSISLCLFNLLPFPVLDGGHIFLIAVEKIRGKNISVKTERLISRIGLSFIVTLAVVVTYNDFLRFFGDKIAKFFAK